MRTGAGPCLPTALGGGAPRRILLPALLLLLNLACSTDGLILTNMSVPLVADLRKPMVLHCYFDMQGEDLYAVKWYKDDQEFFRYMPQNQQWETMSFPVAGIHLVPDGLDCGHNHCRVTLGRLSREHSGGAYRCEISTEAPTFRLDSKTINITVAALPEEKPRIEGLKSSYTEGDFISAKCVSSPADPAPILSWYINGQPASTKYVGDTVNSEPDEMGLVSRIAKIHFQIERNPSREDAIELRCTSTLPGVPMPPQETIKTVALRSSQPQVINNQKLHWYSLSSASTATGMSAIWMLCFLSGVRWLAMYTIQYVNMEKTR